MAESAELQQENLQQLARLIQKQHVQIVEQEEPSTIHVFVDWDYMLPASKLVGTDNTQDPNYHVDIVKMIETIEHGRPCKTRHLSSTMLSPSTAAYHLWKKYGYFIHAVKTEIDRNPILLTCATDCLMDLEKYKSPPPSLPPTTRPLPPPSSSDDGFLYLLGGKYRFPKRPRGPPPPPPESLELKSPQTMVLVIGNPPGNPTPDEVAFPHAMLFAKLIKSAYNRGWKVEVWAWKRTLPPEMMLLASRGMVEVKYFDEHRKDIIFYKTISESDDPHKTFM